MKKSEISRLSSYSRYLKKSALKVLLGCFSKSSRQRQRERHQTKGLMSRTMAVNVRFESLYISLMSSAKQQREMTNSWVFWRTRTTMVNFSCLPF